MQMSKGWRKYVRKQKSLIGQGKLPRSRLILHPPITPKKGFVDFDSLLIELGANNHVHNCPYCYHYISSREIKTRIVQTKEGEKEVLICPYCHKKYRHI